MKYEIELRNGVTVGVMPASPALRGKLAKQAQAKFELDTTPFQKSDNTIDKQVYVDTAMPEYKTALSAIQSTRADWITDKMMDTLVYPIGVTKDAIVEHFYDECKIALSLLDDDSEPNWLHVLRYCLMITAEDTSAVLSALTYNLPITEEEIDTALGIFRHTVRKPYMVNTETITDGASAKPTAKNKR